MKNVKLILLAVSAMLFLGMGNVSAQNKEPKTLIIRTLEFVMGGSSKMIITEPSGISQTIKLSNLDYRKGEDIASNQATIQAEINKWKKEGYEIDGISNSVVGDGMLITTIILSKDE